jgi:hypothetical protein
VGVNEEVVEEVEDLGCFDFEMEAGLVGLEKEDGMGSSQIG